jgi:VWFA-related protein
MTGRFLLKHFPTLPAALITLALGTAAQGQTQDEVVRVKTELVQTDVMVFDRQGNFADGLKRDQFVLKVDGKPREILFFDRITAGSRSEEAQLAAARGKPRPDGKTAPLPLDRGRTVFFFIDDFHLSAGGMTYTKTMLKSFVDQQMGQDDEVAIFAASGQIGFLQQLSDNKAVVRAAAERLQSRSYVMRTLEMPPMSELQALRIEQHDNDVFDYFVDYILSHEPSTTRQIAEETVRARASQLLTDASSITTRTLASLRALIGNIAALPGRKVFFFISEGFLLDPNNSDNQEWLRRTTSAAAHSGVIIYSIDARGLSSGLGDASTPGGFDPAGRLARSGAGEIGASQDALNALSTDTGGRALLNTNAMASAVKSALKESSVYYLLAWRPDNNEQREQKYRRIEVSVLGHPDLLVRFHRGIGGKTIDAKAPNVQPATETRPKENTVASALRASYPQTDLPVAVSLNFVNTAQSGSTLTASIQVATGSLILENEAGTPSALLDIAGFVLDEQGKSVNTFGRRLTIKGSPSGNGAPPKNVFYNHFALIKPGLYQVRIAASDPKRGTIGTAFQWIKIPDLSSKALALSSLIIGEKKAEARAEAKPEDEASTLKEPLGVPGVNINVDHYFVRSSALRFLTFIYNATTNPNTSSAAGPEMTNTVAASPVTDLAVQIQILRDNEPVLTTPLARIQTDGAPDFKRIPYAADVKLDDLLPGPYVLRVTVIDRLAKTSAAQIVRFQVE